MTNEASHLTLDLGLGVTMKLVRIPAGTFLMGSAEPPEVVLSKHRGGSGSATRFFFDR